MWWDEIVFYELYIPSFKDSNKDGIGDFKGITEKLDYLKELGIGGIWLTPFYSSPKVDNGYDISDYYSIDLDYGTMEDFDNFLLEAKQRGIKVIADIVLNHVSSEHYWFKEAKKSKDNKYRDYFFWEKEIPNNWESFFSGTAWEYDESSKEYYYHKFAPEQVDVNWENPKVKKEYFDILEFWMKKGIDGFRLDVINFLSCSGIGSDNPYDKDGNQLHINDINQNGIIPMISEIRDFVKSFGEKFLVGEIGSDNLEVIKKYSGPNLLDVVFNFNLGSKEIFQGELFFNELLNMERELSSKPTLFFGSHDMPRHISRFGEGDLAEDRERAKAVASLYLTAYGVPFIYYGDEIGMLNLEAEFLEDIHDIQGITNYQIAIEKGKTHKEALDIANEKNRDKSRSPMQWESGEYAGFSKSKPWIGLSGKSELINVEIELKEKESVLNHYRKLLKIRNENKVLQFGKYKSLKYEDGLFIYEREYLEERVKVFINFGQEREVEIGDEEIIFGKKQKYLGKNKTLIIKRRKK